MTKDKALHAWFSQFLPSYPTSNVPEDATFPWLTYELITGSWESGETPLTPRAKRCPTQRHKKSATQSAWAAVWSPMTAEQCG